MTVPDTSAVTLVGELGIGIALPPPRVGHIMARFAGDNGDGTLKVTLYVQGANVDEGAEILVNDVAYGSSLHRTLIPAYTTETATLKFPIYHYNNIYASVTLTAGDTLAISVKNGDGQLSSAKTWTVPTEANWDTDGDGLLDSWERAGFDGDGDGTGNTEKDCDLPALGADPERVDVFVQW